MAVPMAVPMALPLAMAITVGMLRLCPGLHLLAVPVIWF